MDFCDGGAAPRPPQAATRAGKPAPTIGPGSGPIARISAKPTSTAEDVEKGKELVARYRTAERDEHPRGGAVKSLKLVVTKGALELGLKAKRAGERASTFAYDLMCGSGELLLSTPPP